MAERRWWQTRRMAAEQYARTLSDALIALHEFVEDELDPSPEPWEAYYTNPRYQIVARSLQSKSLAQRAKASR